MIYYNIKPNLEKLISDISLCQIGFEHQETLDEILHNYFIVRLYSIWETGIKELLYIVYLENSKVIYTPKFAWNLLDSVFANKFLKDSFKTNLENNDAQLKKDYLVLSNNLKIKELRTFFGKFNLDFNKLLSEVEQSNAISIVTDNLESKGIYPSMEVLSTKKSDKIFGYINLIVELRNDFSHVYKKQDNLFNFEVMKYLVDLVSNLFEIIDLQIAEQIILKNEEASVLTLNIEKLKSNRSKRAKDKEFNVKGVLKNSIDSHYFAFFDKLSKFKAIVQLVNITDLNGDVVTVDDLIIGNEYSFTFIDLSTIAISKELDGAIICSIKPNVTFDSELINLA